MENENDFAALLSHEIAHITSRHGDERISCRVFWKIAAVPFLPLILFWGLFPKTMADEEDLADLAQARAHETEADYIGLIYMRRAGFDVSSVPAFGGEKDQELVNYLKYFPLALQFLFGANTTPEYLSSYPDVSYSSSDSQICC